MQHNFMRFPEFRTKAFTTSYDDGCIYDKRLVEIFNEYGIKGTFNLNSGLAGNDDNWHLPLEELVRLYEHGGHEIAVHGLKHIRLEQVDSAIAVNEVIEDRKNLERYTGKIVRGMAYAYGTYDDNVVEIVKQCGIVYARTVISSRNFEIPKDWLRLPATCHHNDEHLFELADAFLVEQNEEISWRIFPKLFYLWGHSYEFDTDDNWDRIEKLCQKIGKRDDVWYATNIEIYEYVQAFERLIWSVDGTRVYNPSQKDVYIECYGKKAVVSAGATISL